MRARSTITIHLALRGASLRAAFLRFGILAVALACARPTELAQPDVAVTPSEPTPSEPRPEPALVEPSPEPALIDPLAPLAADLQARWAAIEIDPKPKTLINHSHYWTSNESSHLVWHEALRGIGGTYVGVGADQNYLLAAWAEASLIVLMDFDQAIVDLHRIYALCFAAAQTPAEFIALWSAEREQDLHGLIDAAYVDEHERALLVRAHQAGRVLISARLRRVAREYEKLGIATFLADQHQYDHLRKLWAHGRVIALRGDLTGDRTFQQVGRILHDADAPVSVLYLSNAEQYFDYGPSFRRNILALPFAESSWVLRTLPWKGHGIVEGDDYHYNRQQGRNFAEWMRINRVANLPKLLARKTATEIPGSSIIEREADANSRPPEISSFD